MDARKDLKKQYKLYKQESPFTMDDYKAVKNNIKTGKAADPDGISPEVLKYCDLDEIFLQFANKLRINLYKPDRWSESNLVHIPKGGDLS